MHALKPVCENYKSRNNERWCSIHFDNHEAMQVAFTKLSGFVIDQAMQQTAEQFNHSVNQQTPQVMAQVDSATRMGVQLFIDKLQESREKLFGLMQKGAAQLEAAHQQLPSPAAAFPLPGSGGGQVN